MALRVLALTRYERTGASSRVRFLQYVPHLEKMGMHVSVQSLFPQSYLTRLYANKMRSPVTVAIAMLRRLGGMLSGGAYDVVWLQREVLPFLPFGIEKILLGNSKLVIDFDDAHHLYYKNSSLPLVRSLFGDKTDHLMRHAAAVTVGNQTLAAYARTVGARNVQLIPSAVDVRRFKGNAQPDRFTVGWIGTPVTAGEALPMVRAPLSQFLADTGSHCVLVGARADQTPDLKAERRSWSEEGEAEFFSQISVGICPLEDTPWNRGKSGYKIIQYMAAGRPALVSPVGIAAEIVVPGSTGIHCAGPQDWYASLLRLHQNAEERHVMGTRAQQIAEGEYDTRVVAARLYRIIAACA
jgi:glycosyltransferase involved in cell wall biosynthesis